MSTGSNTTTFQLKAELEEDMQRWVKQIQHQVRHISCTNTARQSLA